MNPMLYKIRKVIAEDDYVKAIVEYWEDGQIVFASTVNNLEEIMEIVGESFISSNEESFSL